MPKIFEYLGIIIRFYSDEHKPIHVHAKYDGCEMIVKIYEQNGVIVKVTYHNKRNTCRFSDAKRKQLENFIEHEKYEIVELWVSYFVHNKRVKAKKISKL